MSLRIPSSADFSTVSHTSGVVRPWLATSEATSVVWSSASTSVQSKATTASFLCPNT